MRFLFLFRILLRPRNSRLLRTNASTSSSFAHRVNLKYGGVVAALFFLLFPANNLVDARIRVYIYAGAIVFVHVRALVCVLIFFSRPKNVFMTLHLGFSATRV